MDTSNNEQFSMKKENTSEVKLSNIDSKLRQLKIFETDLRNDEVSKARQALHAVFDPRLEWFKSHNIVITYHGSLQYNDPDNLDVDIELIATGDPLPREDFKKISNELEKDFTKSGVWPRKNCETNIGMLSMDTIREGLRQRQSEKDSDVKEDSEVYVDTDAALILSSAVLYDEQLPQLENLRRQVRQLITSDQWLKERVAGTLGEAIKVRQGRRGMV